MASTEIPATSEALLAHIDAGWRAFRDAVARIPSARLEERTPTGWSFKELLAHVAAWEAKVPWALATLRMGTYRWTEGTIDGFNARAAAASREKTGAEVLRELDDAHARLVGAVGAMTEQEAANPKALDWVVESTYAHYAEHAAELGVGVEEA